MKICSRCSQPNQPFYKDKSNADGMDYVCKNCRKIEAKIRHQSNPEKRRVISRRHYANHRAKETLRSNNWNKNNRGKVLVAKLKHNFGLTLDQYQQMLFTQDYCCKICGINESDLLEMAHVKLCVDHDHVTGKVRGLLCQHCNRALGMFRDNADFLRNAFKYVEESHEERGRMTKKQLTKKNPYWGPLN